MAEKEQLKTTEKERIEEFMREYHKLFDDQKRFFAFFPSESWHPFLRR